MIGAVLSLIAMAVCIVVSTAGMLLSGYLKYTSYANALILNGVWFLFYKFGGDTFPTWYPHIMDTDGKNFFVMCGILIAIVLVINRFPKIRVAYYVSSSVAVGIIVASVILLFKGEEPTVGYAVFLAIFALVTIVLQLGAAESRGIDDSGNVVARVVAAIFLMPAPFLVSMIVIDTIWQPELKAEALFALGVAVIVGIIYFVVDTIKERIPTESLSDIEVPYEIKMVVPENSGTRQ